MPHADFYGTQFTSCDFSDADLEGANFARGSLREVKLTNSLLGAADIRGTEFERSNLSEARDWLNARVGEDRINSLVRSLGFRA